MKSTQRQDRMAAFVAHEGEVTVDTLAVRFDVSVETVRRDLAKLENQGRLRKFHGGARPVPTQQRLHVEASFEARMNEERAAKQAIAAKLTQIVHPGDTLFLDTGSTTLVACSVLAELRGLTVITNSVAAADKLTLGGQGQVYLLGGAYARGNSQTVGPMVLEQIGRFRADHAVLTPTGLDAEAGVTDANADEAEIARAMINSAQSVTFLTVPSKFGRKAAFHVCGLGQIQTVLAAGPPDDTHLKALGTAGVAIP
ncbi:DeoR/GlpR family DNA-binding transcription regulator [Fluviibacterium sp. DFM31]|uniref:DeoR/GlpR family DNA-binding transcription regulator n=1 Tax=Meridianimarinicoccus marinus TaxID=3231483 RepID=A0ABV3L258_9RHOB